MFNISFGSKRNYTCISRLQSLCTKISHGWPTDGYQYFFFNLLFNINSIFWNSSNFSSKFKRIILEELKGHKTLEHNLMNIDLLITADNNKIWLNDINIMLILLCQRNYWAAQNDCLRTKVFLLNRKYQTVAFQISQDVI